VDRLPQLLTSLLDCADQRLADAGVPTCRSFINTGPNAPWDSCELGELEDGTVTNGQVWLTHLVTTPDWPVPTGTAKQCPVNWAAQLELGIARCQQGKMDDETVAPAPELITADAALQQVDRFELLQAITCCWQVEPRDIVFDRWESFTPDGGCVASRWLFRVRVGTCVC
jgi:hypothetical protein